MFNHIYLAQIYRGNTLVKGDKSRSFNLITMDTKIGGKSIVGTVKILVQVFHEDE